jgi:hypothetical protein
MQAILAILAILKNRKTRHQLKQYPKSPAFAGLFRIRLHPVLSVNIRRA